MLFSFCSFWFFRFCGKSLTTDQEEQSTNKITPKGVTLSSFSASPKPFCESRINYCKSPHRIGVLLQSEPIRRSIVFMTNSFCQLIVNAAESHADKMAMQIIGEEGTEYTFAEMLDAIRSIAYRLEKEGIEFGDRVALIGENHPRWAIAYFGILFRGAICVPIDPHAEIATIKTFLDNSEAKMAFIGKDLSRHSQRFRRNWDVNCLRFC